MEEYEVDRNKLLALVFDTTSVNTGVRNGIIRHLEVGLGRKMLHLPCRHHIAELVCGAAAAEVYGPSTSPNEEAFKKLAQTWSSLDHKAFTPYDVSFARIIEALYESCNI